MPHSMCMYILCDSANKDIELRQKVQLKLKAAIKRCNYINLTHYEALRKGEMQGIKTEKVA